MKIEVLGCSGGIGPGLATTSLLINDRFLIDAGTGLALLDQSRMNAIERVYLTHAHLDHVLAIPMMADNRFESFDSGEVHALAVLGLEQTIAAVRRHLFNWEIWPDFSVLPRADRAVLSFQPIAAHDVIELDGVRLHAIPVEHAVPALAYVVEGREGVFAFSGDASTNDSLWDAFNRLERLDFLAMECAFPVAMREVTLAAKHYDPELLAMDLAKLRHRPRIGISHLKPGREPQILDECSKYLAGWDWHPLRSGEVIEIG